MLKLNLGAGRFPVEGWQSVDVVPEFMPDYLEDISLLPSFEPGTVDSIYAGHVCEHLENLRAALQRWFEVLKPGGDITITVPDLNTAVELWLKAGRFPVLTDNPLQGLLAVATGYYSFRQAHDMAAENQVAATAQRHRRAFDREILFIALEAAGFVGLEEINEYRHDCAPKFAELVTWQIMVRGFKPQD